LRNVKPPRERREAKTTIEQTHRPRAARGRNKNPESHHAGDERGLTNFLIQPPKDMAAKRESWVTHATFDEAGMADEPAWDRFFKRPDYLNGEGCHCKRLVISKLERGRGFGYVFSGGVGGMGTLIQFGLNPPLSVSRTSGLSNGFIRNDLQEMGPPLAGRSCQRNTTTPQRARCN
jgi:hypothetical protein